MSGDAKEVEKEWADNPGPLYEWIEKQMAAKGLTMDEARDLYPKDRWGRTLFPLRRTGCMTAQMGGNLGRESAHLQHFAPAGGAHSAEQTLSDSGSLGQTQGHGGMRVGAVSDSEWAGNRKGDLPKLRRDR